MAELKHPLAVVEKNGVYSCGGSQTWMENKNLRKCGCGAVAMAELLLYWCRYHGCSGLPEAEREVFTAAEYEKLVTRLQRKYLLMIPPFGITGLSLASGINRFCRGHGLPYRTTWGVRTKNLWVTIETLLRQDLPVILSIGPNAPFVWQKHRLNLYRKTADGRFVAAKRTKAHYVIVMGLDDTWIRVSSWGGEYYLNRQEYAEYGDEHSMGLVHNLLQIKKVR